MNGLFDLINRSIALQNYRRWNEFIELEASFSIQLPKPNFEFGP